MTTLSHSRQEDHDDLLLLLVNAGLAAGRDARDRSVLGISVCGLECPTRRWAVGLEPSLDRLVPLCAIAPAAVAAVAVEAVALAARDASRQWAQLVSRKQRTAYAAAAVDPSQ